MSGYIPEDIGLDTPDDYEGDRYIGTPHLTTWGQIDSSWIGRKVVVRWEEPSAPLADGHNAGIPHEQRGVVERGFMTGFYLDRGAPVVPLIPPEHAHVQEVTE